MELEEYGEITYEGGITVHEDVRLGPVPISFYADKDKAVAVYDKFTITLSAGGDENTLTDIKLEVKYNESG